mmetsp:Transcript_13904/g.39361  ORF Transcript_13904/g.39361 Transcript_13904/m.39361 type:complete len:167 (-) Transcript_13904:349-849(-)|eukprot:CAMPEP_0117666758 /NCGR_PEP_ID=MMETSP0804-20121206/10560_1 /TAXON_ID=1074897 /ORGANISM="Tetraselmis astigmatica, Strain CCMP880" /LENGTH=166 /DNA_ID=CAMNT_0005474351 /DNA_START=46 /DNA_END=546 /DNA_ORIENTATION=-
MTSCSFSKANLARGLAAARPLRTVCSLRRRPTRSARGWHQQETRPGEGSLRALILEPTGDGTTEHLEDETSFTPETVTLQDSGMFEIGRDEPADILLRVATVSGRHALLKVGNRQVAITDLGSTNGTFIDGVQLEHMAATELPIGSEIVFGDEHLCRFVLLDDENL